MRFLKSDLLTLLISLFILAGCKNPDSIGLGVDPSKALSANLIDSTTINTTTAYDDTIATSNLSVEPLAFFKDPTLGTTEANIATAVNLPGESAFTALTDPYTIDSAVLVLSYAKGAYGDLTTTFNIGVAQLNEPVLNKSYYNNRAWNVGSSVLAAAKTFIARPKDSIYVRDIVTGGPDTLKKVAPQLRVPLSKTFIDNNFFKASASALATNAVFQNAIKGLFISLNGTSLTSAHPGATLFFNMASGANIVVYYRVTHASASPDTLVSSLPLGYTHAAQIKHNYSINTDITNQLNPLNPATATFPNVYIQGLSGLRAKISFPYLTGKRLLHDIRKNSFATNPSVDTNGIVDYSINRAELRLTPVTGTTIPFAPLPRLTLYRFDIANQRTVVPDAYAGDPRYLGIGSFGGLFDTYHQSYSFVITGYIEDLLRGKLKDYGTYIAPGDTTGLYTGSATIGISNSAQIDGRTVLGGSKTSPYKMKLNILYNKVTK